MGKDGEGRNGSESTRAGSRGEIRIGRIELREPVCASSEMRGEKTERRGGGSQRKEDGNR